MSGDHFDPKFRPRCELHSEGEFLTFFWELYDAGCAPEFGVSRLTSRPMQTTLWLSATVYVYDDMGVATGRVRRPMGHIVRGSKRILKLLKQIVERAPLAPLPEAKRHTVPERERRVIDLRDST